MSILKVPLVSTYRQIAESATQTEASEVLSRVRAIREESSEDASAHSSAVETAFRELLIELIASLDIENDDFTPVWSLLDALNLLCDNELCDFALGFWLVEDLLDSQTIHGCRQVFNYLESRRERMTKVNFKHKHLSILRCCNELLRRLSRAEDTVFCGRVFIYLFQSFPLGDKSSVNLRGEFHIENITTYDEDAQTTNHIEESMDVDDKEKVQETSTQGRATSAKTDLSQLYPVFWSLQSLFSSPTKLFESAVMQQFKDGIKQTMACFTTVANNTAPTTAQDPEKRSLKRKRGDHDSENAELNASAFNPKYLTNRDLFDLEIQDIEFRRHVLVQALILLDFLLSLSAQGKAKLSTINQSKSIMSTLYDKYTLSEEDRLWAVDTRRVIEKYLEEGNGTEGRYYLRMVNMVLSRDKNWAFWKAEGCPPISRPPVEPDVVEDSQQSLTKVSKDADKTLMKPKGSDQLAFLSQSEPLEALKKKRPAIPTLEEYHNEIVTIDLDLEMADDEEKKDLEEQKAGKLWRALRSARGKRFRLCEDIKGGDNIDALVNKVKPDEDEEQKDEQQDEQQDEPPSDAAMSAEAEATKLEA